MSNYGMYDICEHCGESFETHCSIYNQCPGKGEYPYKGSLEDLTAYWSERNTVFKLLEKSTQKQTDDLEIKIHKKRTKDPYIQAPPQIKTPKAGLDSMVHIEFTFKQEETLKNWGITYLGNDNWDLPKGDKIDKVDENVWLLRGDGYKVWKIWTKE